MKISREDVARNLKFYREQKGLTQRELANKIGVKHNTISSWENGPNSIDISFIMQICDILEISLDEMFRRQKNDSPLSELSERELSLLLLFRKLSNDEQLKFIGRIEALVEIDTN